MRVASASASSNECVVSRVVPGLARIVSQRRSRDSTSSPALGSSRTASSGSPANAERAAEPPPLPTRQPAELARGQVLELECSEQVATGPRIVRLHETDDLPDA